MTQVRHFVDPKPVWTKLKNAAIRFFFDQRQRKCVAIKRDRLLVSVGWTLYCDIGAAGKLRPVKFRHHYVDLSLPLVSVKGAREIFARRFSPFPRPRRRPRNRRGRL